MVAVGGGARRTPRQRMGRAPSEKYNRCIQSGARREQSRAV